MTGGSPEVEPTSIAEGADPAPPALAPSAVAPPLPVDPDLDRRVRRDLDRGRWVARLTWAIAACHMILGFVAVRQSAMLVALDRDLITTEEVEQLGGAVGSVRLLVAILVLVTIGLVVRWLRGAVPTFEDLAARGTVDGPSPTGRGLRRLAILLRPAGVPAELASWSDIRVGSGRPLAIATGLVLGAAVVLGIAVAVALALAIDVVDSRWLRAAAAVDAGLWLGGTLLAGALAAQTSWREAAAGRALGVFVPLVDAPGRAFARVAPAVLLFVAGCSIAAGRPDEWFVPCPQAGFECGGVLVPVDHGGGPSQRTIFVTYAVHPAVGRPTGTLAFAVGGPGASGLETAVGVVEALDPELVRSHDILFWDQRGVGASEGRDCPAAATQAEHLEPTLVALESFVDACLTEAGVAPADVARYATRQAAEDLETIRDELGIERFAVYGESYGTELAQTYAAAHPDRLTALILDGAVDLTRPATEFWTDAARSFDATLQATLDACRSDEFCREDAPDPDAAYAELLERLSDAPVRIPLTAPDGGRTSVEVDLVTWEATVDGLLYEPAGRMLLQRAVAAAAQGDDSYVGRLTAGFGVASPAGASTFVYHAVSCADYRTSPTADGADLRSWLEAGDAAGIDELRTDEIYATPLPCFAWPYQPVDAARPAPLTATPYPIFVLTATLDPITPVGHARAIAERADDAYLVETAGGAHVTFATGDPCVDRPVVDFLVQGERPRSRVISCAGEVTSPYAPLTPVAADDYLDAIDAMTAVEAELFADVDYVYWDLASTLSIGCRHGGFVTVTPATSRELLRFSDCEFGEGLPLSGTGQYDYDSAELTFTVTMPDGELTYTSNEDEARAEGTFRGEAVDETL